MAADRPQVTEWMKCNPHALNLARLRLVRADGTEIQAEEIRNLNRSYDLWTGLHTSKFELGVKPATVQTVVHGTNDVVSVRVDSVLVKEQSAWVQFAHYLGSLLMALPAGWLATKLGYGGGIVAGLLTVALGGLRFIPATQIVEFWAFLLGVCLIAAGLAFLETVANPYTTVLGAPECGPLRLR